MEKQEKYYRIEKIHNRYVLQIYNYYPESKQGPYCMNWTRIKTKLIPRYKKELMSKNIIPMPSEIWDNIGAFGVAIHG